MIIWTGFGILLIPLVGIIVGVAAVVTSSLASDPDYFELHGWPMGLGLLAAAVATWYIGSWLGNRGAQTLIDPKTGEPVVLRRSHSLFFVPFRWWAPLLVIGAIIASTINHTPEELQRSREEREARRKVKELQREMRREMRANPGSTQGTK